MPDEEVDSIAERFAHLRVDLPWLTDGMSSPSNVRVAAPGPVPTVACDPQIVEVETLDLSDFDLDDFDLHSREGGTKEEPSDETEGIGRAPAPVAPADNERDLAPSPAPVDDTVPAGWDPFVP